MIFPLHLWQQKSRRSSHRFSHLPARHLVKWSFSSRLYLTLPQEAPIHFPVKAVFIVIECPPPVEVITPEPLTLSGLRTSIFIVPLDFTLSYSHNILICAFVAVELTRVVLHSF